MLILLLAFFFILSRPVFATGEFSVTQNIDYTVSPKGLTTVHQQVDLTNKFSQIYAKEYQITLSGSQISNLTATDSIGNILSKTDSGPDQTIIYLKFNQPSIGQNQTNRFTIDYTLNDFAKKKGNTWEVQFPQFTEQSDQQIFLTLTVPKDFGDLSFSSVSLNNIHTLSETSVVKFDQNQTKNNKILLVFGNHQLFEFKLSYHLQNDQSTDINTEIALPPDTDSQNIIFGSIDPPPINIKVDADGNWLAQYFIAKGKSIDVTATGQAKIHPPIPQTSPLPSSDYFKSQKYWPTSDSTITSVSQTLSTPKSIYQFVVNTLNYDYQGFNTAVRKGGLSALEYPSQSLCTEFTDLFVTLARSRQIPAREIEGFAYSNNAKIKPINVNSDVLHAWPQYYDSTKQRWIQVDPTWEKTTNGIDYFTDLDLNHIAFVIHGLQSDYPPPPGSYKKDNQTKTVFVDFSTQDITPNFVSPQLTLENNQLIIKNPNLFAIHQLTLTLKSSSFKKTIPVLPPLGLTTINLPQLGFFESILPQFDKYHFQLTLNEADSTIAYNIINQKHFFNLSICIGVTILFLCLGGIILTVGHYKS